jgi:hypothetical protein
LGDGDKMTPTPNGKPATRPHGPDQVRTIEDLREKIDEVRARVDEASKPTGPLGIFGLTTST